MAITQKPLLKRLRFRGLDMKWCDKAAKNESQLDGVGFFGTPKLQ